MCRQGLGAHLYAPVGVPLPCGRAGLRRPGSRPDMAYICKGLRAFAAQFPTASKAETAQERQRLRSLWHATEGVEQASVAVSVNHNKRGPGHDEPDTGAHHGAEDEWATGGTRWPVSTKVIDEYFKDHGCPTCDGVASTMASLRWKAANSFVAKYSALIPADAKFLHRYA